jgi:hypothetical protein
MAGLGATVVVEVNTLATAEGSQSSTLGWRGHPAGVALLVLSSTAGCGDPFAPEPQRVVFVSAAPAATPTVPSQPPTAQELRSRFPSEQPGAALCNEPFLADEAGAEGGVLVAHSWSAGKVLHVDAASAVPAGGADGSAEKPFSSIADALLRASSGTSILVAPGAYRENLQIPGGVRVLGQPPAGVEPAIGRPVVMGASVEFAASTGPSEISLLENFEVHATVEVLQGARVVLENNVLSPTLNELTPMVGNDTHTAFAVRATGAALRAHNNRLFVAAADALSVNSQGFRLSQSCALVTDNHLIDFRTPFALADWSDAAIHFNVIEQGKNGFFITDSQATIVANYASLMHFGGCVYAVYMTGASQPEISHNLFYLQSANTRGVNEQGADSDPSKLVGNAFRLGAVGTLIYLNYQGTDGVTHDDITHIDAVNALEDIPEIGGNSLSVDALSQPM